MNYLSVLVAKVIALLPLPWARALGVLVGVWCWLLPTRWKATSLTNLALCMPELADAERQALARRSLQETAKTAIEACLIWSRPQAWLRRQIRELEGETLLASKLAKGRGLLVLAPHLGNWEMLPAYFSAFAQLTAMYQPAKNRAFNDYIHAGRKRLCASLVPTNSQGVRGLIKALRRGEIVIVLPDQVPDRGAGGQLSTFFGRPALTMTLIHGLIQRTGCEVCVSYMERLPQGFKAWVLEPAPGIAAEQLSVSVDALNASVEACVRRAPSQYQWEYKRFRRLPSPYRNPYRK